MFRCQACGNVVPPRVSAEIVTIETRPHIYPHRSRVMRETVKLQPSNKLVKRDDPGGAGREIVREIRVCPPCKGRLAP
jgi:hypothetical protein